MRPIRLYFDHQGNAPDSGNTHGMRGLALAMQRVLEEEYGFQCELHNAVQENLNTVLLSNDVMDICIRLNGDEQRGPYYGIYGSNQSNYGIGNVGDTDLVCHHLDKDTVEIARQKFQARFAKNSAAFVMINLAIHANVETSLFDPALTLSILQKEIGSPFTVFLCGSRHSNVLGLRILARRFQEAARDLRTPLPVFYHAARHKDGAIPAYNPYLGLLAAAKAVFVFGDSQSTMSEAVFLGKKPIMVMDALDTSTENSTAILDFQKGASTTLTCVPRDRTLEVAREHVRGFLQHAAALGTMSGFLARTAAPRIGIPHKLRMTIRAEPL